MARKVKPTRATFRAAAKAAARKADGMRASDVRVLDIAGLFDLADFFVLASCESRRQLVAIAGEIEGIFKERGLKRLGVEGWDRGGWLLLDYDDVIVHLFMEETRRYYEMEFLWGDARRVDW